MASNLWEGLFTQQPRTIFDVANDTQAALQARRAASITNALNQIKLNYAPQMAQQAADKGAADVSIEQNQAKYAPQMSQAKLAQIYSGVKANNLLSQGRAIDNAMSSEKFKYLPEQMQLGLALQKAQIQATLAKTLNPARLQTVYDATTGAPIQTLKQYDINGQTMGGAPSPANAPQINAPSTGNQETPSPNSASATSPDNAQAPLLPPINPPANASNNAPNILVPAGFQGRGGPEALYNPKTQESFSVLTPTQRTQIQNQVLAIKQALPLLDAMKHYGTIGKFQAGGISKYLPEAVGGISFDDAAKYAMAKNAAIEHVMTATLMPKTNETTDMVGTILDRQNGESRQGYAERINAFEDKLNHLIATKNSYLKLGAINLNNNAGSSFLMDEYNKAKSISEAANGANSQVQMIGDDGQTYNVPANKVEDAITNYKMRRK